MRVAVTGSSGLIGAALVQSLLSNGHEVVRLVRAAPRGPLERQWFPTSLRISAPGLSDVDAVVNLAGAPIAGGRWTAARKETLLGSRLMATATCVNNLDADGRCRHLLNGSAIGYYGDTGDDAVDEAAPAGAGFLADLVTQWEQAAAMAPIPVTYLRTGHVLSPDGGYIGRQLLLFQAGLGGRMGNGKQWLSWISLTDQVRAIMFLLTNPVSGPLNLTAPNPVTNRHFTFAMGQVLRRPTVLPVPLPALRALFGSEFVDEAVLTSQRVLPTVLEAAGFEFNDNEVDLALRDMLPR